MDLPAFAAAFCGTDGSTLEPRLRTLALLRVCAGDHSPYWRVQLEAAALGVNITPDEVRLVGSEEWDRAPAFTDRERAAIVWADRIATRAARRDAAAYELVKKHCTREEIVELTAVVSLAAMATRITNALRIPPEATIGVTADRGSFDRASAAWRDRMFDDVAWAWTETMTER